MRILITGGCGFIGTSLCMELLARGHTVVNVDKLTYAANKDAAALLQYNHNYTLVQGDVCDSDLLFGTMSGYAVDAVMHLAAESHVDRSIEGPGEFLRTNVLGTYGVLEAVRRYLPTAPHSFRLLYVSTDEVFGDLPLYTTSSFNEMSSYRPSSPYSASKAAADHLVRAWGRTYGVPYVITHGANAYGPGQLPDKLIPMAIVNGLRGEAITIHGDGCNVRSWLHVEDHANGLISALLHGKNGESYCLDAGAEYSNLVTVQRVCRELNAVFPGTRHEDLIKFVGDRPGNDRRYAMDGYKARAELRWNAVMDFDLALSNTVRWYAHTFNKENNHEKDGPDTATTERVRNPSAAGS